MKKCGKCKKVHEDVDANFYKDRTQKDGYSWYCKECSRARNREYNRTSDVPKQSTKKWRDANPDKVKAHKQKGYDDVKNFKNKYLETKGCACCGMNDVECLDFHHLVGKPEKRVSAHHTFNLSIKEMAKCIVVCANCHRKLHANTLNTDATAASEDELWNFVRKLYPEKTL